MFFAFMVVSLGSVSAQVDDRLVEIDRLSTFPGDFSARYTVVHQAAEGAPSKRVTQVLRRDLQESFVVITLEPATSAGKGYLRIGASLWLYDPRDRQFTMTSAKDRFEASNARLSDFGASTWATDYRVASVRAEKLGRFDCEVYQLEALRSDVTFARSTLWVSADHLVRKVEDFSLSGDLVRRVLVPSWQQVGDHWAPVKVLISDEVKKEQTQITIDRPSTVTLADTVYTKTYLEASSR